MQPAAPTGMRLMRPQRLANLSQVEEQSRCALTWQPFDEALWRVAFAEDQELNKDVARVHAFKARRQDMVVVAPDQVPSLANIQGGWQLYARGEPVTQAERKRIREQGVDGDQSKCRPGSDSRAGTHERGHV